MRSLLQQLFVFGAITSLAQSGPGGIGSTDGTSSLELWLSSSNFQETGYINGDNVYHWPDLSGNSNDAINDIAALFMPVFISGGLNGHPVLQFSRTGGADRLTGMISSGSAPLTVIAIGYYDEVNQEDETGQFLFNLGAGGASGENTQMSIARQDFNDVNPHELYSFDGNIRYRSSATLNGQTWYAIMSVFNTSSPFYQAFLNNTSVSTTNYSAPGLNANGNYSIGSSTSSAVTTSYLNGRVAEIIVFSEALNDVQRSIIFNYISAKYNLTISNDYYSGDEVANGNFDMDVSGLGRSATSTHLNGTSRGMAISASTLDVGEYVFFGHRSTFNSIVTRDVPGSVDARWSKYWFMDLTSGDFSVVADVSFDFSESGIGGTPSNASGYHLLFNNGSGWQTLATGSSINGDVITFEDVPFTSDGLITLGTSSINSSPIAQTTIQTSGNGPASLGITNGNQIALWLDASALESLSDNDNITSWTDMSGGNRHATQPLASLQPTYQANELNGRAVVRFDGADDYLDGNLGNLDAPCTIVAVGYFDNVNQGAENDYIFDVGASEPNSRAARASISRRRNDDPIARTNRFYTYAGESLDDLQYGPLVAGQQWHTFTSIYHSTDPFHQLIFNGSLSATAPGNAVLNTNGDYALGRWSAGPPNPNYLDGDIAEVIVFNTALSLAQTRILHAHLAAKWNLTMTDDLYNGDDISNGDNDLQVTGVGSSIDGDMEAANSSGLIVRLNEGAQIEGYALYGHSTIANGINNSDISANNGSMNERLNRSWYFSFTGNVGLLDLAFDYSEMQIDGAPSSAGNVFALIYRPGTSGDWTIITSDGLVVNDSVVFEDIPISANGFYTLAAVTGSLPVELSEFSVSIVKEEDNASQVLLRWKTLSESNNHGFVVERSQDGRAWTELSFLLSRSSNHEGLDYSYLDIDPFQGRSYYRLKQVDIDGKSQYVGGVKTVLITNEVCDISLFPNPTTNRFSIKIPCQVSGPIKLSILDTKGRVRFSQHWNQLPENVETNLPPGIYAAIIEGSGFNSKAMRIVISENHQH